MKIHVPYQMLKAALYDVKYRQGVLFTRLPDTKNEFVAALKVALESVSLGKTIHVDLQECPPGCGVDYAVGAYYEQEP